MESSPVEGSSSQDNEINCTTNNSGNMKEEEDESSHFESKKRKTTSKVWNEFTKIKLPDGRQKAECHYCKSKLFVLASESTTHLGRMLQWEHTSRASIKNDWHFVDSNWRLQKRVLSFIHLPPPHHGTDIADNLYKCFKDWNIENKVFTISVDNASNNDKVIKNLIETFSRIKKLPCGAWWRSNSLRCRILSRMARDILAILITAVASEATFSTGSRVINTYRVSLAPETIEVLLCGGDWCQSLHGLKRKNKKEKTSIEVILPIT
uniref:Zinc finger BED domain-containing protein RICESLEEPER 2-like n=1 Tax=Tanacetum cinerariifolium TaxID=118510 RepID=A0A6L2MKS8_TANCI|nr:zinc finger BED domain-containing protein RICESLEEPER 2-like [Tanacetum cinerariifolium]